MFIYDFLSSSSFCTSYAVVAVFSGMHGQGDSLELEKRERGRGRERDIDPLSLFPLSCSGWVVAWVGVVGNQRNGKRFEYCFSCLHVSISLYV